MESSSISSTPMKKRKTEPEVTWTTLVTSLPEERISSIPNLVGLLEEEATCVNFLGMTRKWQLRILEDVLGDNSLLVAEIIKLVDGLKSVPVPTLMDRVHAHELAPSSKLTGDQVMEVLHGLFQLNPLRYYNYAQVVNFITSKTLAQGPNEVRWTDDDGLLGKFTKEYAEHLTGTLHVHLKEASGYAMLGNFAILMRAFMMKHHPNFTFWIDLQFSVCSGKQYCSDQAIILAAQKVEEDQRKFSVVVWEYKPRVSGDLMDCQPWHLSETMLQAYYLKKESVRPYLHCLTDLTDFHYFVIEDGKSSFLEILQYDYYRTNLLEEEEVHCHVNFLLKMTKYFL